MKKTAILLFIILLSLSCNKNNNPLPEGIDLRQEMRDFVINISEYAKAKDSRFLIIPQNGQELVTANGEKDGSLQNEYLSSIDATGREDLFYGYYNDDSKTPEEDFMYMKDLCLICKENSVEVLTTDYCFTHSKMDDSYGQNNQLGFLSFAAPDRDLRTIPDYPTTLFNENTKDINSIDSAQNFLYIINGEYYENKGLFISALEGTNYDLLIIDLFHNEDVFTLADLERLKVKKNGAKRLVVCYMSIGEAEDYRYYWQSDWDKNKPIWLENENPNWKGNYKVRYWEKDWQNIMFGQENAYLDKIINAGFDGVYLDIIDAFEYFESEYQ